MFLKADLSKEPKMYHTSLNNIFFFFVEFNDIFLNTYNFFEINRFEQYVFSVVEYFLCLGSRLDC